MMTDDNDNDKSLARYRSFSEYLALCETRPDLYRQTMREKWPKAPCIAYDEELSRLGPVHDWLSYGTLAFFCREVACFAYRLDHDISRFLDCERKVPEYILKRYEAAKSTSEDALKAGFTPSAYVSIFHGLAGRNFDGSRRLAKLILDTKVFEILKNRADCYFFGNVLMYLMTDSSLVWPMYEQLRKCKKSDGKAFAGIFEGLFHQDRQIAQQGLLALVKFMKRGAESDPHIGYLNTWAIGMANLCRLHGVWVDAVDPQVPADLLIPQEDVDAVLRQWPELGRLPPKE